MKERVWLAAGSLGLALFSGLVFARQNPPGCGTHAQRTKEELFLHRQHVRRLARQGRIGVAAAPAAEGTSSITRDAGNIAVIEDTGGIVGQLNAFDLDRMTVRFFPTTADVTRYRFEARADDSFDPAPANKGVLLQGLGDDDNRVLRFPFAFPFFGASYQQVYVNSDGNLTFNEPDSTVLDRSYGRFVGAEPRIAPLLTDLDPRATIYGVYVYSDSTQVVVTWLNVPLYSNYGAGQAQTFQVRLYSDGRIEFAYRGSTPTDAVVGISPGGTSLAPTIVDFTSGISQDFGGAIGERFSDTQQVDIALAAQKFYRTHGDSYDYLVIFNAMNVAAAPGAVAYEVTTRNHRSGYGDNILDVGGEFGSASRLQSVLNLGPLSQYPDDPNAVVPMRFLSGDTTLSILGHESGHLFLAFASIRDPSGSNPYPMLGRANVHWAFTFDSDASFLEGNRVEDLGTNKSPRFVTTGAVAHYSLLDQYLMGFIPPVQVPSMFVVLNDTIGQPGRTPQVGVTFDGTRRNVSVQDLIQVEGRRTPDSTVAQHRFRFAFLLITARGADATPAQIAQLDLYRSDFEDYYAAATNRHATADTTLARALHFSAFPALGLLQGKTATASFTLEQPADADLVINLSTQYGGLISVPASVTIPAGSTTATFPLTGIQTGVEELTATPADPGYETAFSRVQVRASMSELNTTVDSGDKQLNSAPLTLPEPVVIQVTDINQVPYPNIGVVASASNGGTVSPSEAISDSSGRVSFQWTPAPGGNNLLAVSIAGVPGSGTVVSALSGPAISAGGVVNGATFQSGLSPGSFATIFGASLAAGKSANVSAPFPNILSGVQVLVDGAPAPMVAVSDFQINFVVPPNLTAGTHSFSVVTPLGVSAPVEARVDSVAPGIFFDTATGIGAIRNALTAATTVDQPAGSGDYLEIYCTGLGPVDSGAALQRTLGTPAVTISGIPASVTYSGLAPGVPALYQVDIQVPPGVPPGDQDLQLAITGVSSNTVKVRMR